MSAKEMIVEYLRTIPDEYTLEEIFDRLQELSPESEAVDIAEDVDYSDEELTEDEWRALVAYSLRDELADLEEDIYTLKDGVPPDEAP